MNRNEIINFRTYVCECIYVYVQINFMTNYMQTKFVATLRFNLDEMDNVF